MIAESFIRKIKPDPDGLDFEGFRKEGIRLVQEISGDVWTDYNLHDPGVTILEALCYALTDLVYRIGFDTADFLASGDAGIDFERQALNRPDEALSCRAVTESDYRKLILNAVPNTDNVWIKRYSPQSGRFPGLYLVYVQLSDQVKNQEDAGVRKVYTRLVEKVYAANRNLCEDLASVEIVERVPYSLRGEIEVDGKGEPASVLARVYYECAQYLNPGVPIHSYAERHREGQDLEDLFSGVLTAHGYIAEEDLTPWRGQFSIPELIGKISRIEGVKEIRHLVFVDGEGAEIDCIKLGEHSRLSVACLQFPQREEEVTVSLRKSGKACPAPLHDVEVEYSWLDYRRRALRHRRQDFDWVGAMMPSASFRDIREYYSIQNHFPDVYGLNAYGIPESSSPRRKAQAKQLKAYLLFFEQIMANFLQNVQEIPRLFSLDERLNRSYFHQALGNDEIPNVEEIYADGVERMDAGLAELLAGFDNYADRRSRVLDYLLGMYGEKLSLYSLRQFREEGANADDERVASKIAFLNEIVDIGKNRAAAFDYLKPAGEGSNGTGLEKKLSLLLGLNPSPAEGQGRSGEDIRIVEHILLRPLGTRAHNGHRVPDDFYGFRLSIIFPAGPGRFADAEFRKLAEETVYLNCPAHIHPEVFWLEAGPMRRFDVLHGEWLKTKRQSRIGPDRTDAVAAQLILFLLEIRRKNG